MKDVFGFVAPATLFGREGRMVDILERLQSLQTSLGALWPQPNLHEEAAEKIIQLREELAAVTERMSKLDFERTAAELERDALREENARLILAAKMRPPFDDDLAGEPYAAKDRQPEPGGLGRVGQVEGGRDDGGA